MKATTIIITCEHGGNKIPQEFCTLFNKHKILLATHRGYDKGALEIADSIYKILGNFLFYSETSRLLIDLNRTISSRNLFSFITESLSEKTKEQIKLKYYYPYIRAVEEKVRQTIKHKRLVLHVSVHSFTPVLKGNKRKTDIGLLYDPKRKTEKKFCRIWKEKINELSKYKVRFNYPYHGVANSLTTYLREQFNYNNYIGIELEVNQKFFNQNQMYQESINKVITTSLVNSLYHFRNR